MGGAGWDPLRKQDLPCIVRLHQRTGDNLLVSLCVAHRPL